MRVCTPGSFYYCRHADPSSNCVRQTWLIFCLLMLSYFSGGNALMPSPPAWMIVSKSQSSCFSESNQDRDREVWETCWITPEAFPKSCRKEGLVYWRAEPEEVSLGCLVYFQLENNNQFHFTYFYDLPVSMIHKLTEEWSFMWLTSFCKVQRHFFFFPAE